MEDHGDSRQGTISDAGHFPLSHRQIERARHGASRGKATLDNSGAFVGAFGAPCATRGPAYGRAKSIVRMPCTEYLHRGTLPSSSLGVRMRGKNVTLFSYMVMRHAAHLEIYPSTESPSG
ncbi:hypothetical protein KM043_008327 [Ampulex compressa]|nr:hypothetical protein KM043_008327 [Ampulex compressa]